MNSVALIGRLTKDAAVKRVGANDICIAEFNLAVPGTKKDETTFVYIKAFGKTAEIVEKYTEKGKQIAVEGRIDTESWEKEGKKQFKTLVVAERITLLSSGKSEKSDAPVEGFSKIDDDFIPF